MDVLLTNHSIHKEMFFVAKVLCENHRSYSMNILCFYNEIKFYTLETELIDFFVERVIRILTEMIIIHCHHIVNV